MADTTPELHTDWNERVEYLRGLAQIVRDEGLSLLELEGEQWKITFKGAKTQLVALPEAVAGLPAYAVPGALTAAAPAPTPKTDEDLVAIVTPMVGVFYRSPSPADPPFVEVGDRVEVGQTIGLVEAMKVFNEITAESGGLVAKINVESGQLVETGAPLLMLRR